MNAQFDGCAVAVITAAATAQFNFDKTKNLQSSHIHWVNGEWNIRHTHITYNIRMLLLGCYSRALLCLIHSIGLSQFVVFPRVDFILSSYAFFYLSFVCYVFCLCKALNKFATRERKNKIMLKYSDYMSFMCRKNRTKIYVEIVNIIVNIPIQM